MPGARRMVGSECDLNEAVDTLVSQTLLSRVLARPSRGCLYYVLAAVSIITFQGCY